jgi:simple sugar transport system ATP-binding protein
VASRDAGAGVLLISEDLGELFSISDRLVVLFRGRIVGTSSPQEITMSEVGYLMTGAKGEYGRKE